MEICTGTPFIDGNVERMERDVSFISDLAGEKVVSYEVNVEVYSWWVRRRVGTKYEYVAERTLFHQSEVLEIHPEVAQQRHQQNHAKFEAKAELLAWCSVLLVHIPECSCTHLTNLSGPFASPALQPRGCCCR